MRYLSASPLLAAAVALVPFAVSQLFTFGFYALPDTRTPALINIPVVALRILVQIGLFVALSVQFAAAGLNLVQQGAELWSWLQDGAAFYVCGDASRMAKDVDKALHAVAMEQGKLSEEEAAAFITQLKKDKRYLRDVY